MTALDLIWDATPWLISAISTTVAVLVYLNNRREGLRAEVWADSMNYRLRIVNSGKAMAQNVRAEFPNGRGPVIASEIRDKIPIDLLPPGGCVELVTGWPAGQISVSIALHWEDRYSKENVRKQRVVMRGV